MARLEGLGEPGRHSESPPEVQTPRGSWSLIGLLFFLPVALTMGIWWLFSKDHRQGRDC